MCRQESEMDERVNIPRGKNVRGAPHYNIGFLPSPEATHRLAWLASESRVEVRVPRDPSSTIVDLLADGCQPRHVFRTLVARCCSDAGRA